MNAEQFGGQIRTIAAAGFGVLVGKGYLTAETASALAGFAGVVAVAIWSWKAKKPRRKGGLS